MSPFQVWFDGWWIHHTGTRVRQLVSFTVRTGLAEQFHTYLLKFSAFPTCYFSFCVSTPGRLGVLEALLSPSPALRRNFIDADTAHNPIQAISFLPLTRISSAWTWTRSRAACSTTAWCSFWQWCPARSRHLATVRSSSPKAWTIAWSGQPYVIRVMTTTISSVGLRSPSIIVPRLELNV